MNEKQIIETVRSIAAELSPSCDRQRIAPRTGERIINVMHPHLIDWFNREMVATEERYEVAWPCSDVNTREETVAIERRTQPKRRPTEKGVALEAIICHLTRVRSGRGGIRDAIQWLPELCERLVAKQAARRATRRRPETSEIKPLTEKQTEAVLFVSECEGNIMKAAKRAGIDRKSMQERYDAAMRKLGEAGLKKHKTQQHSLDMRGQENATKDDDRRGLLRG